MKIHNDIEQNSDEWLQLRAGRITGSKIGVIMANYPNAFGDPAKRYASEIALERITGNYIEDTYTNGHMERGHDQEPAARQLYEEVSLNEVEQVGFVTADFGNGGCSPDGLIGEDGMIEIKSRSAAQFFKIIKGKAIEKPYLMQMLFNLIVCERDWCDYVNYCSDYPEGQRLHVQRVIFGDYFEIENDMATRLDAFEKLINEYMTIIKEAA